MHQLQQCGLGHAAYCEGAWRDRAATLVTLDRKVPARYPSVRVELLLS